MNAPTMNTFSTFIHSTPLRDLITAAIFGALASSFAAVSAAADNSVVHQVVVKFGDLNLSNPQGAATLYSRIVAAAHEVCKSPDDDGTRDIAPQPRLHACLHKAIADGVTDVGQPELIAIYNAKNPQPLPITVTTTVARTR
jgi:UrcA family protein